MVKYPENQLKMKYFFVMKIADNVSFVFKLSATNTFKSEHCVLFRQRRNLMYVLNFVVGCVLDGGSECGGPELPQTVCQVRILSQATLNTLGAHNHPSNVLF